LADPGKFFNHSAENYRRNRRNFKRKSKSYRIGKNRRRCSCSGQTAPKPKILILVNSDIHSIYSASDISILKIEEAVVNFNARFDAKKRSYIYLISTYKSPFLHPYSFFFSSRLEITALNNLSKLILGKHDFTSFCKRSGEIGNKICTIDTAYWKKTRGFISFLIEGDRFLHGMVRTIVGTLLNAQKNNLGKEYISGIINSRERSTASEAVPAKGLFLYKVKY
jgi:tRNA pseudouridine38-40 synthase